MQHFDIFRYLEIHINARFLHFQIHATLDNQAFNCFPFYLYLLSSFFNLKIINKTNIESPFFDGEKLFEGLKGAFDYTGAKRRGYGVNHLY